MLKKKVEFGSKHILYSLLRVNERMLNNIVYKNRRFSVVFCGELQIGCCENIRKRIIKTHEFYDHDMIKKFYASYPGIMQ
jgi:hypothetical protein